MEEFDWKEKVENKEEKIQLAKKMAQRVKEGETIGFGSGSTSYLTVLEIGKKVKEENLHIQAVPTSTIIENLCHELEIPVVTLEGHTLDWCFDGADEVDNQHWMIKGMGAALFREKLNLVNCRENYILIDTTKWVSPLGQRHPVPIECHKLAVSYVMEEVKKLGATKLELRMSKNTDQPLITDNGNVILHAWFDKIEAPLEKQLKQIVGVIETGLFIGYNVQIVTGV